MFKEFLHCQVLRLEYNLSLLFVMHFLQASRGELGLAMIRFKTSRFLRYKSNNSFQFPDKVGD